MIKDTTDSVVFKIRLLPDFKENTGGIPAGVLEYRFVIVKILINKNLVSIACWLQSKFHNLIKET